MLTLSEDYKYSSFLPTVPERENFEKIKIGNQLEE